MPLRFTAGVLREGEVRYASGITPTDYQFTGQYSDSYIKLLWYGSRHYDPELGRFIQPDTIVPNPGNSQDWNRYGYARNNPVRFTDPSGHRPCDLYCEDDIMDWRLAKQDSAWEGEWNIKEQEERTEIIEAVLYGGEELAVSILFEPADWALTAYHCANGDCSPLALLGLLPFIPASAGKHVDSIIDTSKVVIIGENMDDIRTVAKQLQSDGKNAKWYQAWSKYWPDRPLTRAELDANLARDIAWMTSKVKQGYTILDLGRDPARVAMGKVISEFYQAELDIASKFHHPIFDISSLRP